LRITANNPSRSDWRLSPDEGDDWLSVPDEGVELSGATDGAGVPVVSATLDEASEGAGPSGAVVVSDKDLPFLVT
jgi:hypothetical protein